MTGEIVSVGTVECGVEGWTHKLVVVGDNARYFGSGRATLQRVSHKEERLHVDECKNAHPIL